ncbi:hypothetical protein [Paenibacillus puerhi]|uniref:hypothetical protein n=1 Tax=Paenibacillus puerhi TaxID=2692622 RepID=UPI001356DE21|nr:hypothetical protein [Paenibacillus puerhi]
MTKAKMTFRFSQDRRQEEGSLRRNSKVIPLRAEEYRIVEESSRPIPAEEPIAMPEAMTDRPVMEQQQPDRSASLGPASRMKPLNDFTTDFGGWQSSFDGERDRTETPFRSPPERQVDPETGYSEYGPGEAGDEDRRAADSRGRDGNGDRPDRDRRWDDGGFGGHVRITRSPGSGSFLRIVISVAGAVVTGVAFGFLVLSMFSAPDGDQAGQANIGKTGQQQAAGASGAALGTAQPGSGLSGAGAQPTSAGAGVAVNLPARSYTILQGGVFSTAQSAEAEVANFRKKGLSAVSEAGEKFTVFVGVAANRDESLGLSQTYKAKEIDVMLKTYEIPAVSQIRWNGKQPEAFAAYMNLGSKLVQLIGAQTSLHVVDKEPKPMDDKALQAIKTAHQAWSQSAPAISDGLGEAGRAALPKLNSALNTAVVTLEEYKKNPSASLLWQAQTAIMQYLVAEKELLKTVSVS